MNLQRHLFRQDFYVLKDGKHLNSDTFGFSAGGNREASLLSEKIDQRLRRQNAGYVSVNLAHIDFSTPLESGPRRIVFLPVNGEVGPALNTLSQNGLRICAQLELLQWWEQCLGMYHYLSICALDARGPEAVILRIQKTGRYLVGAMTFPTRIDPPQPHVECIAAIVDVPVTEKLERNKRLILPVLAA